jgi:hypothetical protein
MFTIILPWLSGLFPDSDNAIINKACILKSFRDFLSDCLSTTGRPGTDRERILTGTKAPTRFVHSKAKHFQCSH